MDGSQMVEAGEEDIDNTFRIGRSPDAPGEKRSEMKNSRFQAFPAEEKLLLRGNGRIFQFGSVMIIPPSVL